MWQLSFITEEQLTNHVKETIKKYGEKLKPFDLKKFNTNIIDPIKLIFDKNVYQIPKIRFKIWFLGFYILVI